MGKKSKSKSVKIPRNQEEVPEKLDDEHSIHIKLDTNEAIAGKKDLLSSEINLLKIFQRIENYKRLRTEEIKKKRLILKKLREAKLGNSKISNLLPGLKIPKILKKEASHLNQEKEKLTFKVQKNKGHIEQQLMEIQEKLNKLSY